MHEHDHCHAHDHGSSERRLGIAFFLTAGFMAVEIAGGLIFNSLALLADAGHMLSDVMALGLSWLAFQIGKRAPGDRHTFGFKRTEILAGLINGLALWGVVGVIFYEAAHRFYAPVHVEGVGMLLVALVGLGVNLGMAALLFRDRDENLNIRGAFLHIVGDALGSLGAIVAAVVILFTGLTWIDPLVSVMIGLLVLYSSWGLVGDSVHILMEGVPAGVDVRKIEDSMIEVPGVCCVYDLHVWSITSNRHALSAHVVLSENGVEEGPVLTGIGELLRDRFDIGHTTIQIERTHEMRLNRDPASCREGTRCNGSG